MHLLVKKCTDSETVEPLNRALSFEVGHARRVPVVLLDFEEPGSSALARVCVQPFLAAAGTGGIVIQFQSKLRSKLKSEINSDYYSVEYQH